MDTIDTSRWTDHLIRTTDLNPRWVPLYIATFALQFACAFIRSVVAAVVLLIINVFTGLLVGFEVPVKECALVIGYAPLLISLVTLVFPWGGWWLVQQMGGRRPSERERAVYELAFEQLQAADPTLRGPRRVYILDTDSANAHAYAEILLINRGLLESPMLTAILGHEMGHLNTADARVTAALYRMWVPPREPVGFPFKFIAWVASGRAADDVMGRPWAAYWRHRENEADRYAAKLGQGTELASYLDADALAGDVPTPFKRMGTSSHPWTEHRIEALEAE